MKVPVCKCCGHPLADEGVRAVMTTKERRLFDIVKRAGTAGIRVPDIIDKLYEDDRDGGPISRNIVCVMTNKMRPRIEPFGVTIVATRGHDSTYYLVPVERKTEFETRHERTLRRHKAAARLAANHVV